jgi:predicted transcriptional regulator
MSWVVTQQFLKFLISKSLIEVTDLTNLNYKRTKKKYSITDRGEKLLAYIYNIQGEAGIGFFELTADS